MQISIALNSQYGSVRTIPSNVISYHLSTSFDRFNVVASSVLITIEMKLLDTNNVTIQNSLRETWLFVVAEVEAVDLLMCDAVDLQPQHT